MTILRRIKSRWIAWRYGPVLDHLWAMRVYYQELDTPFFNGVKCATYDVEGCIKRREELILP